MLFVLFFFSLSPGRLSNCTHPLVPEHVGFRCEPSPCRGFPQKSSIRFFCEPGYHINSKIHVSRCRHGRWQPPVPTCFPNGGTSGSCCILYRGKQKVWPLYRRLVYICFSSRTLVEAPRTINYPKNSHHKRAPENSMFSLLKYCLSWASC